MIFDSKQTKNVSVFFCRRERRHQETNNPAQKTSLQLTSARFLHLLANFDPQSTVKVPALLVVPVVVAAASWSTVAPTFPACQHVVINVHSVCFTVAADHTAAPHGDVVVVGEVVGSGVFVVDHSGGAVSYTHLTLPTTAEV